jgi:hypothetical protein
MKQEKAAISIIPQWLPVGAKKAATLIINKVSDGREPKTLLNRLKRLIGDKSYIEAMWGKLEKSALKAVSDEANQQESVDDRLFMYLMLSAYGDTYFRQIDVRKAARKNEVARYKRISALAKALLQEINSPYAARKMINCLMTDDLAPALDRYLIEPALDEKILAAHELIREEYDSFIQLPKTLTQLESVLATAIEVMAIPSCTMPYKKNAKNAEVAHFVLILKEYVRQRFHGRLYEEIATTTQLALNPSVDVSIEYVRKTKRNIILKKSK